MLRIDYTDGNITIIDVDYVQCVHIDTVGARSVVHIDFNGSLKSLTITDISRELACEILEAIADHKSSRDKDLGMKNICLKEQKNIDNTSKDVYIT